jgi:hypothetical protein
MTQTTRPKRRSALKSKVRVNLHLDPIVLSYYKTRAGEQDYEMLINETLAMAMYTEKQSTLDERITTLRGKYAHVPTSSEAFALHKQQEIDLEG